MRGNMEWLGLCSTYNDCGFQSMNWSLNKGISGLRNENIVGEYEI